MGERFIYDKNKSAIRPTTIRSGAKPTPTEREILSAIKLLEKSIERIETRTIKKKKG